MKKSKLLRSIISFAFFFTIVIPLTLNAQKPKEGKELKIAKIELGYPCPGIPFYHFKADIELPESSIIEVEAAVDGNVLRATDLRRESDSEDMNRPPLSERPPSGYSLSQDGTHYKNLSVVGWVKWQPGQEYNIRISVRMKKTVRAVNDDVWISSVKKVTAPKDVAVFDKNWKSYKAVILSETAGISRTKEAVEILLAFYPDEAQQLVRDIRVVAVDPKHMNLLRLLHRYMMYRKILLKMILLPIKAVTQLVKFHSGYQL